MNGMKAWHYAPSIKQQPVNSEL